MRRVYKEHASAVRDARDQLDRLMERLEAGDTLTVTKMDRLARNVRQLADHRGGIGGAVASRCVSSTSTATRSTPRPRPGS